MALTAVQSNYTPVASSSISEYELSDILPTADEISQDTVEDERLLRNFEISEAHTSVDTSKDYGRKPFNQRADASLAHGHRHSRVDPLQHQSRRVAWQAGVRWVTSGALFILLLNIIIIIYVPIRYGMTNGVATFYAGNCNTVSQIDSGLHVAINVLSTAFLSASNYVMQILNAPSRRQVNDWHARGSSLHIGIPSFRNALRVGKRQSSLWFLLGISAIPLHLFWNSAVFETIEANEYNIFLVSSDFNTTEFSCNNNQQCERARELHDLSKTPGALEYLDAASCISAYSVNFLTGRRNLVLVGDKQRLSYLDGTLAMNGSLFRVLESDKWMIDLESLNTPTWLPNAWWCGNVAGIYNISGQRVVTRVTDSWNNIVQLHIATGVGLVIPECSMSEATAHAADLEFVTTINGIDTAPWGIDYCLSQPVPEVCQLGFAVYIMTIVVVCNLVKVASMVASFWALDDTPLVVIGDALSSFLEGPDEFTKGRCLMEARSSMAKPVSNGEIWHPKQYRWFHAPTIFSIIRCFTCCMISLIIAALLLAMGLNTLSSDFQVSFSSLKFGSVDPSAMIQNFTPRELDPSSFTALASVVLVANSPQLLFSTLYFMYNRLLTAMLAMDEWSRFAYRTATLRVSYPSHGQRSTYWLHLPYLYSVPLLIATTIMHWLVSQSIFLARIEIYGADGNPYTGVNEYSLVRNGSSIITTVGYSPKAIVASIALGSSLLLLIIGLGFRPYRGGIPLIGNNSLAISAACHPPADDDDPAHSKVMWGAVNHSDGTTPGRCCLTSKPVTEPIDGQRYA